MRTAAGKKDQALARARRFRDLPDLPLEQAMGAVSLALMGCPAGSGMFPGAASIGIIDGAREAAGFRRWPEPEKCGQPSWAPGAPREDAEAGHGRRPRLGDLELSFRHVGAPPRPLG